MVEKKKIYLVDTPLIKEYDFENNLKIDVKKLTAHSNKKVNWKCKEGHKWSAIVNSRSAGNGCPYCSGHKAIPGETDLKTINPRLAKEIDEDNNFGINIDELTPHSKILVNWKCEKGHKWLASVYSRSYGNNCPYCAGQRAIPGVNDLATVNPKLAEEFDEENNPGINIDGLMPHSMKKVNWKCEKGHIWEATVDSRTKGHGCPFCSGRKAIPGVNDLRTLNPKLADEFDSESNPEIKLEELTTYSNKKVNWKCEKGHKWPATVYNRSLGYGCPYCAGIKAIPGVNDLRSANPELAEEFDTEKNPGIKLEELAIYSNKNVNWICKKGHRWKARIDHRSAGSNCPYCSGKKAIPGVNDLLTVNPELAEEFDKENNNGIKAEELLPYSDKKVYWHCSKNHVWKAAVKDRSLGHGCPFCSGRRKTKG